MRKARQATAQINLPLPALCADRFLQKITGPDNQLPQILTMRTGHQDAVGRLKPPKLPGPSVPKEGDRLFRDSKCDAVAKQIGNFGKPMQTQGGNFVTGAE